MDAYLSSVYYNPGHRAGFGTLQKLYKASRADGKKYTKPAIKRWLLKNDTYTLYKPQRKNFPTRKTVAQGIDDVHQMDLADMSNHARRNNGVTFLLCVIDVLSKKAWVLPLKSKSTLSMLKAFRKLYGHSKARVPARVASDRGTEFTSRKVKKLLESYGIHAYVLHNRQKAAVAERFVRTLKSKLHKYMDSIGSERYVDKLQEFVKAYNSTKHRSIGMPPNEVTFANTTEVWNRLYKDQDNVNRTVGPRFAKGDRVRISEYKHTFDKGYEQNYTDEIFSVARVLKTKPPTYKLTDVRGELVVGSFYGYEVTPVVVAKDKAYRIEYVIKTKGRGQNKRWLYKYRGYPDPEWSSQPPESVVAAST